MPGCAAVPACSFAAAIYRLRRYLAPLPASMEVRSPGRTPKEYCPSAQPPPQFAINFYCANAPYFRPKSAGISPHSSVSHFRTSVL